VKVRRAVAADDLGYHQNQSALFDLAIGKTGFAAEIRAANLEPDYVIRVMGDGHLVRFFITDARAALRRAHGRAIIVPGRAFDEELNREAKKGQQLSSGFC